MTTLDVLAARPQLQALFKSRPVRLAYLFGSHAAGRANAESDVDIAVLLHDEPSPAARLEERLLLTGELSQLLKTDRMDVVVLNEASPLLAYEVLQRGKLMYVANDADRIEFQVRTLREYEDTAPLRKLLAEAQDQRLRAGTFGKPVLPPRH
jgi:hypothetical protein